MSTSIKIKEVFEADTARRKEAGLPLEQAKLAALIQVVRDARTGTLDADAVKQIVIAEETAHGRSANAARIHAEAVLAGQSSDWAPRDFGYEKGRTRRRASDRTPLNATNCDPEMSAMLSHWANGGVK